MHKYRDSSEHITTTWTQIRCLCVNSTGFGQDILLVIGPCNALSLLSTTLLHVDCELESQ